MLVRLCWMLCCCSSVLVADDRIMRDQLSDLSLQTTVPCHCRYPSFHGFRDEPTNELPTLLHPLSDRMFDRSILVRLTEREVQVRYELGLSELTMAIDLIEQVGQGNVGPFAQAIDQYRRVRGELLIPLMELVVDGQPLTLQFQRSSVIKRDHLEYTFEYVAPLPTSSQVSTANPQTPADNAASNGTPGRGTLEFRDFSFDHERGFRRIAFQNQSNRKVTGTVPPSSLETMPRKASWEMTLEEEAQSKQLKIDFEPTVLASNSPPTTLSPPKIAEAPTDSVAPSDSNGKSTAASTDQRQHSRGDQLSKLLEPREFGGLLLVLPIAFLFGMAHAIKPGHGKTLVAAYLVGTKGTVADAMLLGLTTTLTHTSTVLFVALMLRPFAGTRLANPETLRFWLTFLSGLTIVLLGISLFWRRVANKEDLLHHHGPGGHTHLPDGSVVYENSAEQRLSFRRLLAMGVSGGLIPCDDAVLLLLWAIGAGMLAQAVFILLAFSAGLALVLVMLGIMVVKVRSFATVKGTFRNSVIGCNC